MILTSIHQIFGILVVFVLTRSAQTASSIVVMCICLEKNDVYAEKRQPFNFQLIHHVWTTQQSWRCEQRIHTGSVLTARHAVYVLTQERL